MVAYPLSSLLLLHIPGVHAKGSNGFISGVFNVANWKFLDLNKRIRGCNLV
jgi:hypothetical protein